MSIAPVELSPAALSLYSRAQRAAGALFEALNDEAQDVTLSASEPLESREGYLLVEDGFLKLTCKDRVIRHYQAGDMLSLPQILPEARITTEFATQGRFLPKARVFEAGNPHALAELVAFLEAESQLLAAICAEHAETAPVPRMRIRNVEAGEELIREGSRTDEVFVLLEGKAEARVAGVVVGDIHPTEFIGEISLLTQTACSASVIATEHCMLQVLHKSDLADAMRVRPALLLELATTLAQRLTKTNSLARNSILAVPMTGPNARRS